MHFIKSTCSLVVRSDRGRSWLVSGTPYLLPTCSNRTAEMEFAVNTRRYEMVIVMYLCTF